MTGSRVSLWLGSCSKLPYLIVWWRIETKRTSFWLNLMIPQIPVVCCLKTVCAPSIFLFFDDTTSWHSWQCLSSPERVTHDTWQVCTQNIFPLISIIRIFSVCPSFPFFWPGVPRTNGMHDDASLVAWHTHMFWHQKTAKKINECVCVHMTRVASWHHQPPWHAAPGDRWWWPGIVCQQVPPDFMIHNKVRCPQDPGTDTHGGTRGQLILHLSQFSQAWQHFRETITCHMQNKEGLFRFMIRCIFGQYLWGFWVDDWRMQKSCLSTQRSVLSFNIRYLFFVGIHPHIRSHQFGQIWAGD